VKLIGINNTPTDKFYVTLAALSSDAVWIIKTSRKQQHRRTYIVLHYAKIMISCQEHPREREMRTGRTTFNTYDCDNLTNFMKFSVFMAVLQKKKCSGMLRRRTSISNHQ